MLVTFSESEETFRRDVRQFFKQEYPRDLIEKQRLGLSLSRSDHIRGQQALQTRGWLAYPWPAEHGGPGFTAVERYIFEEELERAGAPSPMPMAVVYIGPVIYTFGSDEQIRRWLPDILSSRAMWAQGYSEAEAGSDLAAIALSAERHEDHYVLNGTKLWTSYAHWADWIFCLVRTSRGARRQDGITFLCIDMRSPGITVRPIPSIDGHHHLNAVEFVDVVVPLADRIGDEGKGWHYATYLLRNERLSYAHVARKRFDIDAIRHAACDITAPSGGILTNDPLFMSRLAECDIAVNILEFSVLRILTYGDDAPIQLVAALKIEATELAQTISTLALDIAGPAALRRDDPGAPTRSARSAAADYLYDRSQTIFGGTTEIQKTLIWRAIAAEHVTGVKA